MNVDYCDKCDAPLIGMGADIKGCSTRDEYKAVALHYWALLAAIGRELGVPEMTPFNELPKRILRPSNPKPHHPTTLV